MLMDPPTTYTHTIVGYPRSLLLNYRFPIKYTRLITRELVPHRPSPRDYDPRGTGLLMAHSFIIMSID